MPKFQGLEYSTPITIRSNVGLRTADSQNLRVSGADIGAQRWELSIALQPSFAPDADAAKLAAHRARHARIESFSIVMPQVVDFDSGLTATVSTDGAVQQNAATVDVDSPDGNDSAEGVKVGRFIKFANHSKVYMVVGVRSVRGNQELTLEPRLVSTVGNNGVVSVSPSILVIYDPSSPVSVQIDAPGFIRPRLQVFERL